MMSRDPMKRRDWGLILLGDTLVRAYLTGWVLGAATVGGFWWGLS